jgi:copper transport protein
MRRSVRAALVLGATLAAVLLGTGTASAHAELDSSNPVDGTNLAAAPDRLHLRFSLPVEMPATRITLTDGGSRPFAVGPPQEEPAPVGATAVGVPLPPLPPGTYRIDWRTISTDDQHVTSGVIVFGVQRDAPPAAAVSDPPPDPAESVARWVGFTGLAALLGAVALFGLLGPVPPGPRRDRAQLALATTAVAGGVLAFAGDVALLLAQAVAAAGPGGDVGQASVHLLTGPPRAPRWWAREAALAVLLGCAVLARAAIVASVRVGRRISVPVPLLALGVAAAVTTGVTGAMLGHSVGSGPLRVATDAVHELSAMTWVGGLLAVVVVLVGRPRDGVARAVLTRFSLLAGTCVAVLTVSGLLLTGSGVASLDALLLSHFGAALLVKVALMVVALGLALVNTVAVRRRTLRPPRLGLVAEAAVLVLALAAAAVLGASPHATGPAWRAPDGAVPLVSGTAADLIESVAVSPNLPGGPNFVTVRALDSRRPAPAPIGGVTVHITGPDGTIVDGVAQPAEPGTYVLAVARLDVAGPWDVRVTVTRPGLDPVVADYPWTVADPTASRRPVVYSADPIGAPLGVAAALAALIAGIAAYLALRGSRRVTTSVVPPGRRPVDARNTATDAQIDDHADSDADPGAGTDPDRNRSPAISGRH